MAHGIIHGDLFIDNIFFKKNRLSGIIDFYFAANDYFMYEIAICINALCFDVKKSKFIINKQKVKNLIKGYESIKKISLKDKKALNILCLTNPGFGGWAAIINKDGGVTKITGNEKDTTNNRMELLAPINALKNMDSKSQIEIYTDSQYVKLGITEWINKWVTNNWQTSKKEDVKNKDLWIELYNLNKSLNIKWNWVKAHSGNPMNEEVDLLAKKAANLD